MARTSELTEEEDQEIGRQLYRQFVARQFHLDENIDENSVPALQPINPTNHQALERIGRDLCLIAEEIEQSPWRAEIQNSALKVRVDQLDEQSYTALLDEFFVKGFSREKVVTLFMFCTDLAKHAYLTGAKEACARLFYWTLQYIAMNVVNYVRRHGGWIALFSRNKSNIALGAVSLAIVGTVYYATGR